MDSDSGSGSSGGSSDTLNVRGLPRSARRIDGAMESVKYTARDNGTVYLVDSADDKMLYSARVTEGDRFRADSVKDRVYINDKEERVDQKREHEHVIFFDAERSASGSGNSRDDVPSGAEVVREGKGELQYRPRGKGTVYITDERGRMLTKMRVSEDDTVRVEPSNSRVTVNGRRVDADIDRGSHKIYFETRN